MNGNKAANIACASSEVLVVGKAQSGVDFTERAALEVLAPEEFSFRMVSPVEKRVTLLVNFRPDDERNAFWVSGEIVRVQTDGGGEQSVLARVTSRGCPGPELGRVSGDLLSFGETASC